MVWEQGTRTIVMVTGEVEEGKSASERSAVYGGKVCLCVCVSVRVLYVRVCVCTCPLKAVWLNLITMHNCVFLQ